MRELVPRVADNLDQFTPDELYYMNRRITRFNVKTVTIISSDDHRWNVSPGLINKPQYIRL